MLPVVLLSFSIIAIHSIAENKPEKERVCLASKYHSQPIAVRSKDRNSRQEPDRRKWRRGETIVLIDLLSMSRSACLFITQDYLHASGIPTVGWASHIYQLRKHTKEMPAYQHDGGVFPSKVPSLKMPPIYIKLIEVNQHTWAVSSALPSALTPSW